MDGNRDRRLSRREMLRRAGVTGAGLVIGPGLLAACGEDETASAPSGSSAATPGKQLEGKVTVANYGGTTADAEQKAWFEPFMQANPDVEVLTDDPLDPAKLKAMVEADRVTWDIVELDDTFGMETGQGLLQPLDCAVVPCDDFPAERRTQFGVPFYVYSVVLGYNAERLGDATPAGWSDFFDVQRFPGKRGALTYVNGGIFEIALLADGVPAEQLYPIDADRALRKLDTIKSELVWWDTGAQSTQLLADGEVAMCQAWNARVKAAAESGSDVRTQWNENLPVYNYLGVVKGSPNRENAMALIAFMVSAEHNAALSEYVPYAPTHPEAIAKVAPDVAEDLPSSYADQAVAYDPKWWGQGDNTAAVDKKFKAWLQS